MQRRTFLTYGGAFAVGAALVSTASAATPNQNVRDYARVRGSAAGRPTYWLTRGIKYAQSDATLIPLHSFVMLECVCFDMLADGRSVSRTLEAGCTTALDGGTPISTMVNPQTGEAVAAGPVRPMEVIYNIDIDGRITAPPAKEPGAPRNDFAGMLSARAPATGETWVEERFRSAMTPANGETGVLTEAITYMGRLGPAMDDGATLQDVTKSLLVLRTWPYASKGPVTLTSAYQGRKYLSFDEAMSQPEAAVVDRAYSGFAARLKQYR